jgi:hypothetical protein
VPFAVLADTCDHTHIEEGIAGPIGKLYEAESLVGDIIFVANAELAQVDKAFAGLSMVIGPIITGLTVCQTGTC